MKILVDGYNLARPEGTGVATYARGFIKTAQRLGHDVNILMGLERSKTELAGATLSEIYSARQERPIVRRLRRLGGSALAPLGYKAYRLGELPAYADDSRIPPQTTLWNHYGVFAHAIGAFRKLNVFSSVRLEGVHIAHWTYPLPLRVDNAVNIYTLHDLVPLAHPELTLDNQDQFKRLCEAIASRADHLLTVSESSKREIITHLGVPEDRVTNTFQAHGITESDRAAAFSSSDITPREYGLTRGNYFLFAGAIEPKKNLPRLLAAYFESGSATPLVLVGALGWDVDQQLKPLLQQSGAKRANVRLLGYQSRETLLALMCGAKAVFFPSLTEGFGLPAVESMALGTPVLASRNSGLGEVVGNAAALIDPLKISNIAAAIRRLDADADWRQALARAGRKQADKFSVSAYAARLEALFDRLQSNPARRT